MESTALAIAAAFLIGAYFYCRKARHPQTQPLAAFLIFAIVFAVSAFSAFAAIVLLLRAIDKAALLNEPVISALFLVFVLAPAFLIARWQVRKPPHTEERA